VGRENEKSLISRRRRLFLALDTRRRKSTRIDGRQECILEYASDKLMSPISWLLRFSLTETSHDCGSISRLWADFFSFSHLNKDIHRLLKTLRVFWLERWRFYN